MGPAQRSRCVDGFNSSAFYLFYDEKTTPHLPWYSWDTILPVSGQGVVVVDYFSKSLNTSITLFPLENINSQRISSFDATLHYNPDALPPTFCLKLVWNESNLGKWHPYCSLCCFADEDHLCQRDYNQIDMRLSDSDRFLFKQMPSDKKWTQSVRTLCALKIPFIH